MKDTDTVTQPCAEQATGKPLWEWHFTTQAQYRMVEKFKALLTSEDNPIPDMLRVAQGARKCRELHSNENFLAYHRGRYGRDCCFYSNGDVVFVTITGNHPDQKKVATIYSLSEKMQAQTLSRLKTGNSRETKGMVKGTKKKSFKNEAYQHRTRADSRNSW